MEYRVGLTAIISTASWLLGGYDKGIEALLVLVIIDYLTGIFSAIMKGELSSKVGLKGICKKFFMFAIIAMAVQVESFIGQPESIHNLVVWFFVGNEAISIVENIDDYIELPPWLKKWLKKFKNNGGTPK